MYYIYSFRELECQRTKALFGQSHSRDDRAYAQTVRSIVCLLFCFLLLHLHAILSCLSVYVFGFIAAAAAVFVSVYVLICALVVRSFVCFCNTASPTIPCASVSLCQPNVTATTTTATTTNSIVFYWWLLISYDVYNCVFATMESNYIS